MKRNFGMGVSSIAAMIFLAGTVFGIAGCDGQSSSGMTLPDLGEAIRKTFNVKEGFDAEKKTFVCIVALAHPGPDRRLVLRYEDKIAVPAEASTMHGAVLALGKMAQALAVNVSISDNGGQRKSQLPIGKLKLNVTERSVGKKGFSSEIVIAEGNKDLFKTGPEKESFQNSEKMPDMESFSSLFAANGLKIKLLGWSKDGRYLRLAYSIRIQKSLMDKIKVTTKAGIDNTIAETKAGIKKAAGEVRKKLTDFSQKK